jgi:archaeal flagellin FlaB
MNSKLRGLRNERGITALETAIILIAFVVVASVFAFTILSAGTFSTERGKEAIYAGLSEVRGSMELKGSVIATGATVSSNRVISTVVFSVATAVGGEPIDLTAPTSNKVVIDYRDSSQIANNVTWSKAWKVKTATDNQLLESGELAEITVPLSDYNIVANTIFALEIKPPSGPTILLERTAPAYIDDVNDLK